MADTAKLVTETALPVNKICANATGIEKGELLQWTSGNVVLAASDSGQVFGGIAAGEKIAGDGVTSIAVYDKGKFRIYATSGAAITAGNYVSLSGANMVQLANATDAVSGGHVVGVALDDTVEGVGETIEVELRAI